MQKNVYRKILARGASMRKRDPRPIPPRIKKQSLIKKVLLKSVKDVVADTYDIVVGDAVIVIETSILVSRLQNRIAMHAGRILEEAIISGQMPVAVFMFDTFSGVIDMGHGRVMEIGVRLHEVPIIEHPTTAEIIVKKSDLIEPWKTFFDPIPDRQRIETSNIVNNATGEKLQPQREK